jgi:L-lactate dehydrogenase complex protein LldE
MGKIALFVPCYVQTIRPNERRFAERVLAALDIEFTVITDRCCGQPAFNSGFRDEAKKVGTGFLRAARDFDTIVTLSGSCTSMAREYLPSLFEGIRATNAATLGRRTVEFAEFVANAPGVRALGLELDGTVAYHDPCHVRRELGASKSALRVLGLVKGLDVRRIASEDECCGFGGTFATKFAEVSEEMGRAKLENVAASGAHVIVSGDVSCLAQLQSVADGSGIETETWTIAEVLAGALP